MESIFDFLFSNIWLVIILFGIISSFFGKKDKTQQEPNRSPRPVAGPIDFPWEQEKEEERPVVPPPTSPRNDEWDWTEDVYREEQRSQERETIESVNIERIRETVEVVRASARKEKEVPKVIHSPTEADDSIREALNFRKMNQEKVIQGIIWSQVLGKPRAKEPHRTFTQK